MGPLGLERLDYLGAALPFTDVVFATLNGFFGSPRREQCCHVVDKLPITDGDKQFVEQDTRPPGPRCIEWSPGDSVLFAAIRYGAPPRARLGGSQKIA